jgi:putative PIN family toxin of toxin-antitoxin system
MRIVADTNTVVSGLLWSGPPRQLIDLCRRRVATLCTSHTLLAELAEVVGRDKFVRRLQAAELSAGELLRDYSGLVTLVEPAPLLKPVSRDPDDDHVIACALGANADWIVSGDADLLDLGSWQGIEIVNAGESVRSLGATGSARI